MMQGVTFRRQATLPVTLRLPDQPEFSLEFVIDTGFTESLTLPPAAVAALNLPFLYNRSVSLADDSVIAIPVHVVTVLWNGLERQVSVLATGRRPLLGTSLLDEQELCIQFRENGMVTVEQL